MVSYCCPLIDRDYPKWKVISIIQREYFIWDAQGVFVYILVLSIFGHQLYFYFKP